MGVSNDKLGPLQTNPQNIRDAESALLFELAQLVMKLPADPNRYYRMAGLVP